MFFKRSRKTFPWLAVCLSALGVFQSFDGMVRAQTPAEARDRDLWQTVQTRKLLLDDPQLGPLNLGVKVTNRVAVLWGPVPSQELSFRAVLRLRTMFELIEIRNRLSIEPDDNVVPNAPLLPEMPQFLPDPLPPVVPNIPRPQGLPPKNGVELAGIATPEEILTARSSPLGHHGFPQAEAGLATLRMPFLGSFLLPR